MDRKHNLVSGRIYAYVYQFLVSPQLVLFEKNIKFGGTMPAERYIKQKYWQGEYTESKEPCNMEYEKY